MRLSFVEGRFCVFVAFYLRKISLFFITIKVDQGRAWYYKTKEKNMVEVDKEYANKGVAGAGLGLGIAGTALGLLNNGNFGGILGGGYSRYEADQAARIAELETEVKLRDANTYTLNEMNKMRNYVDSKFDAINAQLCGQAVINAQVTANLSCLQNTVNTLSGLTKTIIPIDNICPPPMERYNSWVAPTT